jgi:hypothetical protein
MYLVKKLRDYIQGVCITIGYCKCWLVITIYAKIFTHWDQSHTALFLEFEAII